MQVTSPRLQAVYFDGTSAKAHAVALHIHQAVLHIHCIGDAGLASDMAELEVPVSQVLWPERTRHGKRMAELPSGGMLQCADGAAWDAWCNASGLREASVVVLQQSWRWVAAAALSFVVVVGALYQWGLPVVAQGIVALTPHSIDERIGQASLEAIDEILMRPSELPLAQQASIRSAFSEALAAQTPDQVPHWKLEFRKSKIGPNALALPGGTMLMTDDLVELVDGDTRVLVAVLAHELGHVQHRHGLRNLVQVSALGAMASLVLGDFSSALAAAPALIGQAHYSREAEREADAHALQVLRAAGIPPTVMVTLFHKLEAKRQTKATSQHPSDQRAAKALGWLGIAFASHPSDAERMAFFQGTGTTEQPK